MTLFKTCVLRRAWHHVVTRREPGLQDKHQPKLNGGIVVKTNANQRYATSAVSAFILKEAARRAGVAVQVLVLAHMRRTPCVPLSLVYFCGVGFFVERDADSTLLAFPSVCVSA